MTHAELVRRAVAWLRNTRRCRVVLAEYACSLPLVPDVLGFKREWSVLVECKASRSDFFADRKKPLHGLNGWGPGQERWYLAPPGLLTPGELPDGWGLLEAGERRTVRVRDADGYPCPTGIYRFDSHRMQMDLVFALSALRRAMLGVEWHEDSARFEPYHTIRAPDAGGEGTT